MRNFTPLPVLALLVITLTTTACTQRGDPDDPAYGGFFKGIENISDGTYDERIATREDRVAAAQARQLRVIAERNSLQRQINGQENALARLKHELLVAKVELGDANIDSATLAQVNQALVATPTGQTDAERLQSLQQTIANTRRLAASLASLTG